MQKLKRLMKPRAPRNQSTPPPPVPDPVPAVVTNVTGISNITTNGAMMKEMILIYDGDGTIPGEIIYMTKKFLGLGHCSACEISHGPRAEKPEFTALKTGGWSVPLRNIHRNEMDKDLRKVAAGHIPCLVAKTTDGHRDNHTILLDDNTLVQCAGNVHKFENQVNLAIERNQLQLPPLVCALPNPQDDDEAVVPQQ